MSDKTIGHRKKDGRTHEESKKNNNWIEKTFDKLKNNVLITFKNE